mmetsp:Transcript_8439/g.11371  ORF Transcript_8439/g.11371 Transcript_8439/m.11371 type:complete len:314 (-) Transcript_8439:1069-2010(-)
MKELPEKVRGKVHLLRHQTSGEHHREKRKEIPVGNHLLHKVREVDQEQYHVCLQPFIQRKDQQVPRVLLNVHTKGVILQKEGEEDKQQERREKISKPVYPMLSMILMLFFSHQRCLQLPPQFCLSCLLHKRMKFLCQLHFQKNLHRLLHQLQQLIPLPSLQLPPPPLQLLLQLRFLLQPPQTLQLLPHQSPLFLTLKLYFLGASLIVQYQPLNLLLLYRKKQSPKIHTVFPETGYLIRKVFQQPKNEKQKFKPFRIRNFDIQEINQKEGLNSLLLLLSPIQHQKLLLLLWEIIVIHPNFLLFRHLLQVGQQHL